MAVRVIYVNGNNLQEIKQFAPNVAMALGYFDGVHLGHQKVIQTVKEKAKEQHLSLAVLSFFPHPKSVLFSDIEVSYLEPLEQKVEKLERPGVDIFYIVEFTKELAKVKASGTVQTLDDYADTKDVGLTVDEELKWNDQKISSTLIRKFLIERKLRELPSLLGGLQDEILSKERFTSELFFAKYREL